MFHLPLHGYDRRVAFKTNWFHQLTALKNNKTLISIDRAGRKQTSRSLRLFNENVAWIESYFSIKNLVEGEAELFSDLHNYIYCRDYMNSIRRSFFNKIHGNFEVIETGSNLGSSLEGCFRTFIDCHKNLWRHLGNSSCMVENAISDTATIKFIAGINITSESECDNKAVKMRSRLIDGSIIALHNI